MNIEKAFYVLRNNNKMTKKKLQKEMLMLILVMFYVHIFGSEISPNV